MYIVKGKEKGVQSSFNGRRGAHLDSSTNAFIAADRLFTFVLGYCIKLLPGAKEDLSVVYGMGVSYEFQREVGDLIERLIAKYNVRKSKGHDAMLSADDDTDVTITFDPRLHTFTISRSVTWKSGIRGWMRTYFILNR